MHAPLGSVLKNVKGPYALKILSRFRPKNGILLRGDPKELGEALQTIAEAWISFGEALGKPGETWGSSGELLTSIE